MSFKSKLYKKQKSKLAIISTEFKKLLGIKNANKPNLNI